MKEENFKFIDKIKEIGALRLIKSEAQIVLDKILSAQSIVFRY